MPAGRAVSGGEHFGALRAWMSERLQPCRPIAMSRCSGADPFHHLVEGSEDLDSGGFERRPFRRIRTVRPVHERTGMAHAQPFRRAAPGDQGEYRLRESARGQALSELLFFRAADLTD